MNSFLLVPERVLIIYSDIKIMRYNQKGKTKLELTIIILVLAVLGYLAYYSYTAVRTRHEDDRRVQNVHKIYQSLVGYLLQKERMPRNPSDGKLWCDDSSSFLKELTGSDLLREIPRDTASKPEHLCYYNYGSHSKYGAVVGIKVRSGSIKNVCYIDDAPVGTPNWCDSDDYYCLCQPYKVEVK